MKKHKDTDYLHISARIRCIEGQLMTNAQLTRLAEAGSAAEAAKLLEEKGWPAFDWRDMGQAERAIGQRRRQVMDLLYQHCPDPQLIEVFRLKYDYHNIKAILKGDAQRVDPLPLLSDAALIPPKDLARMMRENELDAMNPIMAEAVLQAKEMLDRTSDPQLSDMVLDRAERSEERRVGKECRSRR